MTSPAANDTVKAYAASVGFTCIFSLHYLAASELLKSVTSFQLGAMRGLAGGLILLVIFRRHFAPLLDRRHAFRLIAVGALGFCLNQVLLLEGLKLASPTEAALFANTIPLVSATLAFALRREPLAQRQITGLVLGFAVVTAFVLWQKIAGVGGHALGDLLIFANIVCLCLAMVLAKDLTKITHEGAVTAGMLLVGGAVLAVFAGSSLGEAFSEVASNLDLALLMIFEIVVVTAFGYLLNLYSLKRLPVAATMSLGYFQTPLTAAASTLILAAPIRWRILPTFGLLVVAAWLIRPTLPALNRSSLE